MASQGLSDGSDSTYYPEEAEPNEVDPELAKCGLGSFGKVIISTNLWNSVIPNILEARYKQWEKKGGGFGSSKGFRADEMMHAIWKEGGPEDLFI